MPVVETSLTLSFLFQTQCFICSKSGIFSGASCAIRFLFFGFICFMEETAIQISMRNFSVREAYLCRLISRISLKSCPGDSKLRPAGQIQPKSLFIRPAELFHSAAKTFYQYRNEKNILTKNWWCGRMQHILKQSHYVKYPAFQMLYNSLCCPRTKIWRLLV